MKLEELSRILREKDPAAVLVDPAVLVRVVQNVTGITWVVWDVPHSHCFVVERHTLYKHVEQEELHLPADHHLPHAVLLLERPTAEQLNGPAKDLLSRYWQLLFHAAAHRELDRRLADLTPTGLRERIEQLGPSAFEEARNVLVQDGLLMATADDRAAYAEFAAYFLELRFFNPTLVPVCFPSLPPVPDVEAVLARDVDGPALLRQTRLPHSPDPAPKTDDQSDESHEFYTRLERAAKRAAAAGDTVGAAILHTRAARVAPGALTGPAQAKAREEICRLVDRLQAALKLADADAAAWKRVLPTLLDKADQGARPVEAALLYDIQRACLDHEQKIYTLDLAEWVFSGGKRPIKRELAGQRYVRVPAQLRSATRRLAAARLTDADRQILAGLLRNALDQAENQLRSKFGPILTLALHDAGLRPTSLPEKAALEKAVEELLDRISSAGFLAFGDVRDAIARGQMKLPDLSGPHEYVRGDPLLRLDRRLAAQLDGVYRRAESYTRGLERLTALNFGTETGRWLTRNVTLPFGAAFLIAQFFWLMVFERLGKVPPAAGEPGPTFFGGWNSEWWFHAAWGGLGVFFLLVIQSATVRGGLAALGRTAYRAARFVFWEVPTRVWADPRVRALVASVPVQIGLRWVVKPLILAGPAWAVLPEQLWRSWAARVVTFVAAWAIVNTKIGRVGEAVLLEAARGVIELIRSAPAVLRWLNDLFRDLVYILEWVLARTEDWLRLRGSAGRLAVAVRAVAGLVWMPFAFLLRFYLVVLIEPMLNPLKLPLSILFAKFIYPLLLLFPGVLQPDPGSVLGYRSPLVGSLADYLTEPGASVLVLGTLWLLPDACTFLFWEMRENWRLYRANRPAAIRPVAVGPHGETVKGLLHWGFHSGTVPRLFAKLRAAEQEAARTDVWRDARTYRAALRGVEEAVRRFVTRDFIEVLNSPESGWDGPRLCVGRVILGTNRIRLELVPEGTAAPAWLEWEDRSGWLVAGWAGAGFLSALSEEQARVFGNALAYLYKRAGVDVVREQVRAELPKEAKHFDIGPDGLLVWYGTRESPPLLYDLGDPVTELRPRVPGQRHPTAGPILDARRLIFARIPLTWSQWTEVWRPGPAGDPRPRLFGPADGDLTLLPPPTAPPPPPDLLPPNPGPPPEPPPFGPLVPVAPVPVPEPIPQPIASTG
ncbi:MAG: hypothetical protein JWO38_7238 [Gemmataceae bacterium]|nr:hypothetical protein [Gemmataceae bacterium]